MYGSRTAALPSLLVIVNDNLAGEPAVRGALARFHVIVDPLARVARKANLSTGSANQESSVLSVVVGNPAAGGGRFTELTIVWVNPLS